MSTGEQPLQAPPGFRKAAWRHVRAGETVYILGSDQQLRPVAYGPHWVVSPEHRTLRNARGRTFTHAPEDLLYKSGLRILACAAHGAYTGIYSTVPLEVFFSTLDEEEGHRVGFLRAQDMTQVPDEIAEYLDLNFGPRWRDCDYTVAPCEAMTTVAATPRPVTLTVEGPQLAAILASQLVRVGATYECEAETHSSVRRFRISREDYQRHVVGNQELAAIGAVYVDDASEL